LESIHKETNSPQRRTTAGMQEVEQCLEQLPKERKVFLFVFVKEFLCVLCVLAVKTVFVDEH
jgi:hypothetical protein